MSLACLNADGRAAYAHAGLTAYALIGIHLKRCIVLNVFKQGAGPA